ncbi:MAG: DNA polymerase III subunit [Bryobacteraceae bacterium]|nr:DNA polymerase III subunit [Bryobacteraceae bacterium]
MRDLFGNQTVAAALSRMIEGDRIPQTILLAGPEGVGKATLARRFAASLLGDAARIEQDDLSLPANLERIAEREKLPTEKRAEDPLYFATHPDFVTFPPDGPLRQISIQQMRLLKDRAQFSPSRGRYRVFLIDHLDRANEQAANSLLKTLEEPPPHLVILSTAENYYDLLPTIRSRSVIFHLSALSDADMAAFAASRGWDASDRRVRLAAGSPGIAVAMDLEEWDKRRQRMLALMEVASRLANFSAWVKHSETIAASKSEKLDNYVKVLYSLLEDVLLLREGAPASRNVDFEPQLARIAAAVSFDWILLFTRKVDELAEFARRNIQKGIALDAVAASLRRAV